MVALFMNTCLQLLLSLNYSNVPFSDVQHNLSLIQLHSISHFMKKNK